MSTKFHTERAENKYLLNFVTSIFIFYPTALMSFFRTTLHLLCTKDVDMITTYFASITL